MTKKFNPSDWDVFDDGIECLTEYEQDELLAYAKALMSKVEWNELPCACKFCDNWIDTTDGFYRIGEHNENIICMICAEPIIKHAEKY